MNFRKPQTLKRYSDGEGSPCNRKKTKLLSTTIATPELHKKEDDPFDDNFSQFFRSQFIRQIDAETSIVEKCQSSKRSLSNEYNFTQIDGLTQFLNDSQLETTITSGQRCTANESIVRENDTDQNENWRFTTQFEDQVEYVVEKESEEKELIVCEEAVAEENSEADKEDNEEPMEPGLVVQSSQAFLHELTTVQMNISSIVNETINASKFSTQDFLDPGQCSIFNVFKSTVTASQYLQLKRSNESVHEKSLAVNSTRAKNSARATDRKVEPAIEQNTEMIEDQLLAEMLLTTQALNRNTEMLEEEFLSVVHESEQLDISERLNECIDPDSSALNIFLDDDDKENNQNVQTEPQIGKKPELKETPRHSSIAAVKRMETVNHSPVTAANFYSMGPFFGLPLKVKKLIKTYKNIDDLYGKQ